MKEKCSCGYTKNDYQVERKSFYTKFGWFLVGGLGMSAKPIKVEYKCNECGDVLEIITDTEELKKYIGR